MPTLQSVAPIFPTADLHAMQSHYEALGFVVQVHGGGYGTAARDGVRIHFRQMPRSELGSEAGRGSAYLSETSDLFDPGFGVWEAAHVDADGNLLRFGSPLPPRPERPTP